MSNDLGLGAAFARPTREGRRPGASRGIRSHLGWDLEVPAATIVRNPWPNARIRYQGWQGRRAVIVERGDGPVLLIGPIEPPQERYSRAPVGAALGTAVPYGGGSELLHLELYRWGPPPSLAQRLALTWGELPQALVTDWDELVLLLGGAPTQPAPPPAPARPPWIVALAFVVVVVVVALVVALLASRRRAAIPSLEEASAARGAAPDWQEEADLRRTYRRVVGAPAPPRASTAAMRATIERKSRG